MMTQNAVKENPLLFYGRVLVYVLTALAVRVAAFVPLLALRLDGPVKWLCLLCPVLVIFVVLPLRYSFAEAIMQRPFSFATAYSFANYGEKLTESLLHVLHVIKWGVPLAALGVLGYYWYNQVDALTVLNSVTDLGKGWAQLVCSVKNLFGGNAVPSANTLMDGLLVVGLVIGLAVLIWLYGAVRNSANRYIWVLATRNDRAPRAETRRRLRCRRWQQLGVALINLVLWIPFILAAGVALKNAVSDLSTMLLMSVTTGSLTKLDLTSAVWPLALAFAGLYLPLLPVRRILTAAFAGGKSKVPMSDKAAV